MFQWSTGKHGSQAVGEASILWSVQVRLGVFLKLKIFNESTCFSLNEILIDEIFKCS